jgi:hypothetical protein
MHMLHRPFINQVRHMDRVTTFALVGRPEGLWTEQLVMWASTQMVCPTKAELQLPNPTSPEKQIPHPSWVCNDCMNSNLG